ncbi:MAG: metallophosphoesterase family protein [Deinococcales bacterium]
MGIRLAIITDLHHGRDTGKVRGPEALSLLKKIIEQIHKLEPDAVLELGDRLTDEDFETDKRHLLELANEFKRLPYPRHHISGTHDTLPKALQESILGANLGSHATVLGGWTLVFLETIDGTTGGLLTSETLGWLEQTLTQSQNPVAVFSHQPLHGQWLEGNPYFAQDYREHACAKNASAARTILEASGKVRLCVSGHAHWFDQRTVGGIPYITLLGPTESHWSNGLACGAFSLLELGESIRLEQFGAVSRHVLLGESTTPASEHVTIGL